MPKDDWNEWSKFVLNELKRLNEGQAALQKDINSIKTDIALLKLKSGIWGLAGGAIPVAIALITKFL